MARLDKLRRAASRFHITAAFRRKVTQILLPGRLILIPRRCALILAQKPQDAREKNAAITSPSAPCRYPAPHRAKGLIMRCAELAPQSRWLVPASASTPLIRSVMADESGA